jgi:hypothetical protein
MIERLSGAGIVAPRFVNGKTHYLHTCLANSRFELSKENDRFFSTMASYSAPTEKQARIFMVTRTCNSPEFSRCHFNKSRHENIF